MKAVFIAVFILTFTCYGGEFSFVEKSNAGVVIRSHADGSVFVYEVSGSDFFVREKINGEVVRVSLEEQGNAFSLKKHEQAARSVTYGRFVSSPANFAVVYPDGYNAKNLKGDLVLRLRYREVEGNNLEGELRLSEVRTTEVRIDLSE